MNPDPRSKYVQPHIRFWCRGQIALSARQRIDTILKSQPMDAQAMIGNNTTQAENLNLGLSRSVLRFLVTSSSALRLTGSAS